MKIRVKFGPSVAYTRGNMKVGLADGATVADLKEYFRRNHPALARRLCAAYPMSSGRMVCQSEPLVDGQEILFISALSI
jgi:hypothetical protein